MMKRKLAAVIAVAVTAMIFLTGCSNLSDDSTSQTLVTAVVAGVPHATDAIVSFGTDGLPTQRTVGIKVYVTSATPAEVATAVDTILQIAWVHFPVEPASVSVSVVEGARMTDSEFYDLDGVDLVEAASTLGTGGADHGLLTVSRKLLEERYGAWATLND